MKHTNRMLSTTEEKRDSKVSCKQLEEALRQGPHPSYLCQFLTDFEKFLLDSASQEFEVHYGTKKSKARISLAPEKK